MIRLVSALVALALSWPLGAQAQSASEIAAARGLFRQGLAAARQDDWETARRHFARSYGIAPRASTLLNLAGAQAQTGRLVDAAESYRRFIREASGRSERLVPRAREALEALEPRLAHVTVTAPSASDQDVVTLDDDELPRAALGVELPVDPGAHRVALARGDDTLDERRLELAEGERRSVALEAASEPVMASVPPEALVADRPDEEGGDDTALIVGLTLGGVAAVAVGVIVGVVVAVDSSGPHQGDLGMGVVEFD